MTTYLQQAQFQSDVVVTLRWPDFKTLVTGKGLLVQYISLADSYRIFAVDDKVVYTCVLIFTSVSSSYTFDPDYSQAQNDTDVADFETNYKPTANAKLGIAIYRDLSEAIAQGLVPGVTSGRAQGYVATSAAVGKVVRATAYTPQGANAQRSVNSTNVNDTAAGTGARTVTINYLTSAFVLKSETVTLNGTGAVNTVGTDIAYLESIVVASVGSGGGNAGTIQVFTATAGGGSVWGSVAASDNQTFWAHHYVPAGVTCYILSFTSGATAVAGQCNMNHSGNPSVATNPQLQIGVTIIHQAAGTWDHDFEVPLAIVGPDLIWLVERPTASTASSAVGGFEYIQF